MLKFLVIEAKRWKAKDEKKLYNFLFGQKISKKMHSIPKKCKYIFGSFALSAAVVMLIVMDRDIPKTWVFGFWKCCGEMGLRQVEQGFSSFLAKFLAYLMIFQSGAH